MGMFQTTVRAASLAALILSLGVLPVAGAPPVEAFGRLPFISNLKISPDGTHFAGIQSVAGRPSVVVYAIDPAPGAKPEICGLPDAIAQGAVWVNNDRLLCILSGSTNFRGFSDYVQFARAISVSVSGKPAAVLLRGSQFYYNNTNTSSVATRDLDDPQSVYVTSLTASGGDPSPWSGGSRLDKVEVTLSMYKADVESGHGSRIDSGNTDTVGFIMDSHGKIVARLDDTRDLKGHLFLNANGTWTEATTWDTSKGGELGFAGLTADEASLVVSRYGDNDTEGLDAFSRTAKSFGQPLFRDPSYDMAFPLYDDWTGNVIGAAYQTDTMQYRWFDPERQSVQKTLEAAVPGESVQILSVDKDHSVYLVSSEAPQHPKTYYAYRPATHQMAILATEYPELQPTDLGVMKPYPYKSRDGLDIHAYLTLPPGKTGKNLPTVILPHGGPEERDGLDFDWMAQFFASRGYAVLQPNFRGSYGYGWKFRAASFGEWGRNMQNDITDGVNQLIVDGIADPNRICIVGGSYGGYAALAGATFTPDLYACAVSLAGISDVEQLIWSDTGGSNMTPEAGYWQERLGNMLDHNLLRERSPVRHAENVRAPILLIHADQDVTVPIDQSQEEQTALQQAGKHVEFVTLKGDNHHLQIEQTRIQFLKEVERFLATYIGN